MEKREQKVREIIEKSSRDQVPHTWKVIDGQLVAILDKDYKWWDYK